MTRIIIGRKFSIRAIVIILLGFSLFFWDWDGECTALGDTIRR